MAKLNIIDISSHNGILNWNLIKGKVDGVIIRAGYRGWGTSGSLTTDTQFVNNIKSAISIGLKHISVYWLSQAINTAEAVAEAKYVSNALAPYKSHITMPVYLDSEWSHTPHTGRADGLSKSVRTDVSIAFLNQIKALGYKAGIYASTSWFSDKLDDTKLQSYSHWCADYRGSTKETAIGKINAYPYKLDGWQYSENGKITGINCSFDKSYFYSDFGASSNSTTVNESTKPSTGTTTPTVTPSTSNTVIGKKITLSNANLYASSTSTTAVSKKSGTFYIYSSTKTNNRYRITTSASNAGKTPAGTYVTGWIDASLVDNTPSTSTTVITTGKKITLSNANLYASSTSTTAVGKKTGTFYIYSSTKTNNRYRITTTASNAGKTPAGTYVTGWIDASSIK